MRALTPTFRDRLPLGDSPLQVSPFCIGMVKDPRVVSEAYERGVNFFFLSADMHWPLYEATRRGLSDLFRARPAARDEIVVSAVAYVAQPEFTVAPFLEVIDAVPGLERVDLTIVGGMRALEVERIESFAAHRASGRVPGVRATGATFHARTAAAPLLARSDLDIAFIRYNADHRGAEHDVFPLLEKDDGKLVFNFKSTGGFVPHARFDELGFDADAWRPSVADHYRFVLGRPELDGILCAPKTLEELAALERALARGPLGDDELSYMKCVTDVHLGRARVKRAVAAA